MPLPEAIMTSIYKRINALTDEAWELKEHMASFDMEVKSKQGSTSRFHSSESPINTDIWDEPFYRLRTRLLSLLNYISPTDQHLQRLNSEIMLLGSSMNSVQHICGILSALWSDLDDGLLDNVAHQIQADVAVDYLKQARALLSEGTTGNYDHISAAVLTGAILEDSLRRLCQRQIPPVSISKPNDEPKGMGMLIDDLKKSGLFNELKAKQLRAWADVRNAAAHGQFAAFTRTDVEHMLTGIEQFQADYL